MRMPRIFIICWQLLLCSLTTATHYEISNQNLYFRLCGMGVEIGDWGGGGAGRRASSGNFPCSTPPLSLMWRRAVQGARRGGEANENLPEQPRAVGAGLTVTYRGKKLFKSLEQKFQ